MLLKPSWSVQDRLAVGFTDLARGPSSPSFAGEIRAMGVNSGVEGSFALRSGIIIIVMPAS